MINFWVYREDCFCLDPLIERYYHILPFNKISTDGMVDLSFGMWFDDKFGGDIKVTIYILDKGYKI